MPDDKSQARDFIARLDKHRYASFQAYISNQVATGSMEYPSNLTVAFTLASNFKVTTPTGGVVNAAVYSLTSSKPDRHAEQDKETQKKKKGAKDKQQKQAKAQQKERTPSRPCRHCGELHYDRDCPSKPPITPVAPVGAGAGAGGLAPAIAPVKANRGTVDIIRGTVNSRGAVLSAHSVYENPPAKGSTVRLDNQSDTTIFKDWHLLTNIHTTAQLCELSGINGDGPPLRATQQGTFRDFGPAWLNEAASENIIAWKDALAVGDVSYDSNDDVFLVQIPDGPLYSFVNRGGRYVCVLDELDDYEDLPALALDSDDEDEAPLTPVGHHALVVTVSDKEKEYTAREVTAARQARDLIRVLGYPSPRAVISMIVAGTMINCPVTAKDIMRAYSIYGPDVGALRGRTTHSPAL